MMDCTAAGHRELRLVQVLFAAAQHQQPLVTLSSRRASQPAKPSHVRLACPVSLSMAPTR